jgi:hypothetical protein
MLMNPKVFPVILLALQVAAAITYACHGDWRKTLYWLFAGGLTVVVTF